VDKETYMKEVDAALEIWSIVEKLDWASWHRVISILEQLRNQKQRQVDEINKAVYANGGPIPLNLKG